MPALRTAFSEKLRSLVDQEKSIAHVCRELSINRQQFNRYLSGETMPSEQNISKLAGYFGFSVNNFFDQAAPGDNGLTASCDEPFLRSLSTAFESEHRSLREGAYFFYFPYPGVDRQCIRGLLVAKTAGAKMRFKGCLNLRKPEDQGRTESWLHYSGLVREKDSAVFFLGSLREDPADIFMLNVKPVLPGRSTIFAGISTSARASTISARRLAIEHVSKPTSIFKLARMCGMLSMDGPDVSSWIRSAISSDMGDAPSILQPRKTSAITSS
jgi:transcriptional regulator with XRE-family HTH domain